jgi:dTDP-4-dehydrorhamnose reductase
MNALAYVPVAAQLVIGASGQIGEHLLRALGGDGVGTYFENPVPGLSRLDARDEHAVAALLRELRPEVVYLTASEPNVDLCEREPDATAAINVGVVEAVARAVHGTGARLVFFSTDYVFDGAQGPYAEDDEPNPLSEYGRQKLAGERWTLETDGGVVVRTAVVYSWERQRKNFVVRLIDADREGARWRVPTDQVGSPTYAPNLAQAVVELAGSGAEGIFHVAGSRPASRYEFAVETAGVFGLRAVEIEPAVTADLDQAACRPLSAALHVDKAQALLRTPLLPYHLGLRSMAQAQ